ncbi:hypothetical protein COLO4_17309 [Corchorus olitorius]|uniref:FBD domain-containing protein n=1 Tax=Corchorus olitorius TaxID=93759 RepID=A0A1R3JDD5_9ROSI|nr:hypothetical protein COLO4_17309 [Corchorus olitorius]
MSKAQSISKFSFDWSFISELDEGFLRTWINAAVRRNVQELSLNFFSPILCFCSLERLFACKTLVSLQLGLRIYFDVPANIHLPCLRILELLKLKYLNDDSLRRLISSSPVLEDLKVVRTLDDNIVTLDINVPSLKRITVVCCACPFYDGFIDPRCKLLIKAPLLERIDFTGEGYSDYLIEGASNLAEAKIKIISKWLHEHQFFKLLKVFANVRFLCLVPSSIWSVCPPKAKFPMFHNLVRLDIQCCCVYRHGFMALLEYSDNLEQLVYHNVELHQGKCDRALVGSVPKCVSMRLKSINFRRLSFNVCAWTLPRYFLRNAKFLKQMKIGISSRLKKNRRLHLGNLLKYPRASVACEIGFFRESTKKEINLGPE